VLRRALSECTARGFVVQHLSTGRGVGPPGEAGAAEVAVQLQVQGKGSVTELAAALSELDGMVRVDAEDASILPG